ncbi:hypothetical protein BU23DRAFT_565845 [Bimuria novae-zelandiae CBS 107.79]|uniref:C2H2 type master regulator of conidiophore development brlA n=1 Tax=Bimuria novae-zelandiae CBS 107.79 TaxID=1447943 RepID=A0A6A5VK95_9PLEO|nr:hypothetical protein BU23DRAFT_565845 [Bimuria novae-zelandiae CBS 107.79]
MYTLLVVALLLALFFDTAAATSPVMDPTMPAMPALTEPFYPDPEGMLAAICELCGISVDMCMHAQVQRHYQIQHQPTFTPDMFYEHPDWPSNDTLAVHDPAPEPVQIPFYPFDEHARRLLLDANVRQLEDNATTVQPSTVQMHVEDTYTPGDRLASTPRRPGHKRQAPRPRGFPCAFEGCGKTFDRSCDLKRHQKTHLGRSERPHKCSFCPEGFLYPKDRNRHERTHDQSTSSQTPIFCCPVPGCTNPGFSRRDNLLRHQRKQHPHMGLPQMSSPQMSP